MAIVYLALGSNVGDSKKFIESAKQLLQIKISNCCSAPIYLSRAMGFTEQANFANTVVSAETNLSPQELLLFVKETENQIGRTKTFRWGPREIDIDILFYDDLILDTSELTIPHPHFKEREFVLQPLSDIAGSLRDPKTGKTVNQLLSDLPKQNYSIIRA